MARARGEATLQRHTIGRPGVHGQIEAVPVIRQVAEVAVDRQVVVHTAERGRLQQRVGQLLPAAGQPGVIRRGERVEVVVGGRDGLVIGEGEVPPRPPAVAELGRHSRHQLLLHRGAELPVVGTHIPPAQQGRIDPRRRAREGAFVAKLEEVLVAERAAEVASACPSILRRGAVEIAVGREIAVVDPRPGGRLRKRRGHVGTDVDAVVGRRLPVLRQIQLDRCLAVAEHVIRQSHARGNVVVTHHALGARQRPLGAAETAVALQAVQLLGEEAPGVFVAQCTLQCQPAPRPLVLDEERVVASAIRLPPRRDALCDLVRHSGVEPILQSVIGEVAEDIGHLVRCQIANLHAVRARDVRCRRAPDVVRLVVVIQSRIAVIHHVRHGHSACQAPLLHGNERLVIERPRGRGRVPVAQELRCGSFEQQLVRDWRRVRELHDVIGTLGRHARFRRPGPEPIHRNPVVAAYPALIAVFGVRAGRATRLILEEAADLVPLGQLSGHAPGVGLAAVGRPCRDAPVDNVVPLGRVASVQISEPSGDVGVFADGPGDSVKPDPIAHDRAAHGHARIPVAYDLRGIGDTERSQLVVDVVALRPLAGQAAEKRSAERVAARFWNDVELRPAAVGFTESTGHGELHFLGVRCVIAVSGHAAAVERRADVHAVHLYGAFIASAAPRREEHHRRIDAAILNAVGLDPRGRRQQIAVPARCRQHLQHFIGEHALHARAVLHVHNRRLAADGNRFLNTAYAHIGIDGECHAGRHLDASALDGYEAGKCVGDGVRPWCQVLYSVLAGAVADRRSDLLNQRRACSFNGHARQHRS